MKFFWITVFFYLPVFAQDAYEVRYSVRLNDRINNGTPEIRRHEGLLRVEGQKSLFLLAAIDKHPNSTPELSIMFDTILVVMAHPEKNELYEVGFSFDRGFYWVKDTLYPMKWTIDTATKKIGELNCTRATCFFRGRHYTAWFTPDIPISKGPWKMGGLPGLIVELEDEGQNIVVNFMKITNGIAKPVKIPNPTMDWKDYILVRKKALQNFAANLKAEQKADCLTCNTEVSTKEGEMLEKY